MYQESCYLKSIDKSMIIFNTGQHRLILNISYNVILEQGNCWSRRDRFVGCQQKVQNFPMRPQLARDFTLTGQRDTIAQDIGAFPSSLWYEIIYIC